MRLVLDDFKALQPELFLSCIIENPKNPGIQPKNYFLYVNSKPLLAWIVVKNFGLAKKKSMSTWKKNTHNL